MLKIASRIWVNGRYYQNIFFLKKKKNLFYILNTNVTLYCLKISSSSLAVIYLSLAIFTLSCTCNYHNTIIKKHMQLRQTGKETIDFKNKELSNNVMFCLYLGNKLDIFKKYSICN